MSEIYDIGSRGIRTRNMAAKYGDRCAIVRSDTRIGL